MAICIPKKQREALSKALKEGDITLARLFKMTDAERNLIFKQYVGKDFASFVNAEFERAMLSNQKKSLANWINKTTKDKDPIRRDILKKVERVKNILTPDEQKGFLKDLAELKLGLNVTEEEAKTILTLKKGIDELKVKIPENAPLRSEERLAYGFVLDDFKEYVGKLKLDADSLTLKERISSKNYGRNIIDLAGITKSLVATLDNSFIGRQGLKTLLAGKYKIWGTSLKESLKNFGKELVAKSNGLFKDRGDAVMRAIRADVYSRPNALNGKYTASKNGYGLGVLHEEAFPTSFPEKIPLIGRLFKASESAFGGSAIRMRADLADAVIASAEKNGIDMLDEVQASSFGKLVSSMTGRGSLGKVETIGRETNALFFSIKFLKSNWDTLTAHQFDKTITPEAKKVALKNLMKIGLSIQALLTTAKIIDPDSVDNDPRKGRYGKIRVKGHDYDITGGMGGLITLGSRLLPTKHNGEWGLWSYSKNTRKWRNMADAGFGEGTALDYMEQFMEGKLSPLAGAARDVAKGQNFEGDKPNFVNTTIGLITPISLEMLIEEFEKGNDDLVIAMGAEFLGFSVSDTTMRGYGTKWEKLKEKEDTKTYNDALKQVTEEFNKKAEKLESSSRWDRMDNEARTKELQSIRKKETDRIFNRYGIR